MEFIAKLEPNLNNVIEQKQLLTEEGDGRDQDVPALLSTAWSCFHESMSFCLGNRVSLEVLAP